jgi:class 3 adenylate cyclase/pimeloyl-ACP methyl ester carboxylesterase
MDKPDVRYARSGDVSVAYATIGDGPIDVVFVSGWILSNLDVAWEGTARDLYDGISSFARLILFDKRGTGLSDRSDVPDLETRADDIRAVMDAVGSRRAAILGFSEGGPMAMVFAATYPERAAALVLYGTYASAVRADDYPWALTREEIDQRIRSSDDRRGTDPWIDEALRSFSPTTAEDEATRGWWRRWVRTSASPGATRALSVINTQIDVRHVPSAVTAPTLVLHRDRDEETLVEEGRYLADRILDARFVELSGVDHAWWVNSGQIVAEVRSFLDGIRERGEWEVVAEPERVLATILFTDIVGSTAKLAELGDRRWRELLQQHHAIVRRQLTRFSGRELDTAGDGFFASFDGPARAIRCASTITRAVRELGLEVRAGLHTGECEVIDGKVGGIAVHIGSRVASQARANEVLVSSTVKDLVAGSGIAFQERGIVELSGIPGEWRLFSVPGGEEAPAS